MRKSIALLGAALLMAAPVSVHARPWQPPPPPEQTGDYDAPPATAPDYPPAYAYGYPPYGAYGGYGYGPGFYGPGFCGPGFYGSGFYGPEFGFGFRGHGRFR